MLLKGTVLTLLSLLFLPGISFSQATETSSENPEVIAADTATSDDSVTEGSDILISARISFCNLRYMSRKIGDLGSFPYLDAPQATDCLHGSCRPNFYEGTGATRLLNLPSINESPVVPSEIFVQFKGHHCEEGCTQTEFHTKGSFRSNGDSNLITLEYKVKNSEIYDASFSDVKVFCPLETCEAVISAEYSNTPNRVMLTKTRSTTGSEPVIKLYVNAGPGSTFTTSLGEQSVINKCERVEI